jgi:hypothetical protein
MKGVNSRYKAPGMLKDMGNEIIFNWLGTVIDAGYWFKWLRLNKIFYVVTGRYH